MIYIYIYICIKERTAFSMAADCPASGSARQVVGEPALTVARTRYVGYGRGQQPEGCVFIGRHANRWASGCSLLEPPKERVPSKDRGKIRVTRGQRNSEATRGPKGRSRTSEPCRSVSNLPVAKERQPGVWFKEPVLSAERKPPSWIMPFAG